MIKKIVAFVLFFAFFCVPAFSAQSVTIEFWHAMRGEKKDAITELVNQFMKENPDIIVKEIAVISPDRRTNGNDYTFLYKKMIQALAMQQQPDLAQVYENWTTQFVEINAITPVSRFDNTKYALSESDKQDFFPIFRNACSYNNVMWTIPFNKSIYVMFYNEEMLKSKGVKPPKTWSELREAAAKLTVRENGQTTKYGLAFVPTVDVVGHLLYSNGGEFISGNRAAFGDRIGLEAIDYWVNLVNNDKTACPTFDAYKDFLSGKAAIYLDTTSRIGSLKSSCPFEYGIAVLPSGSSTLYQCAGTNLAIFSSSEERKLASWRLIKFLTNKENTVKLSIATGYLPVRQSAYKSNEYQTYLKEYPGYKVGIDALKYGVTQPRISAWESIRGFINDAVYSAVSNPETSKEALKRAVYSSDELLKGVSN